MGIFSRLGTLIRSNINDMISKAENPEKMLNQVLVDMRQQLVEAKKQVAVAIADEKRLKKQYEDEAAKAADWERKAMMAVRAGDDELARQALSRKAEHDESTGVLKRQWEMQRDAVERLKESLRGLNAKIEEAKRKKNILIARKKRAEAQRTIHQTMAGLNDTSAFETFDRMAARIDQLEAEAEAGAEIAGELGPAQSALETRFKQLEAGHGNDQALLELKEKMGLLPAGDSQEPEALPEGTEAPELDAELEKLKQRMASGAEATGSESSEG
ncbi:MAG: PspA/IM30 family protein [Deltaproteobacteria bacterium]|nr:PspA/IM30 family protein [Deltaproteobacteria bacterium]